MPARRPEELHTLVCQAVNAGDIPAALALYEPNASFVVEPGKVVTGTEAISRPPWRCMSRMPASWWSLERWSPARRRYGKP
jgi:ketosteroid isomerase-like protein